MDNDNFMIDDNLNDFGNFGNPSKNVISRRPMSSDDDNRQT